FNRKGNFLPSRFLGGYGRPWNISEGVGRGMRSRQDGPSRRPLPRPRAGGSDLAAAVGLTAGIVPPSRGWTGRFGERTGSCHQAPALARADQNNPPPCCRTTAGPRAGGSGRGGAGLRVGRGDVAGQDGGAAPASGRGAGGEGLPHAPVHEIDQLVVHRLRLLRTRADRGRGAVLQVVAHELTAHTAQSLVDRCDLHHDVRAVAVLLHHPLESADLPIDPAQALQVALLDLRVHRDRSPAAVFAARRGSRAAAAAAHGDRPSRIVVRVHALVHHILLGCSRARCSRRLLLTTLTELNAIAALASTGLSSTPKAGYSTPAATGMPITL